MAPPKASAQPKTVVEYIAAADQPARNRLRELRKIVRLTAPGAREELKWNMPAYSYHRILVMFAGFKQHISLFPGATNLRTFKKELTKYKTSAGTVQFPLERPVPATLVRRLVAARVKESLEKDGNWRTQK